MRSNQGRLRKPHSKATSVMLNCGFPGLLDALAAEVVGESAAGGMVEDAAEVLEAHVGGPGGIVRVDVVQQVLLHEVFRAGDAARFGMVRCRRSGLRGAVAELRGEEREELQQREALVVGENGRPLVVVFRALPVALRGVDAQAGNAVMEAARRRFAIQHRTRHQHGEWPPAAGQHGHGQLDECGGALCL
jgi:hypothetical protein